MYLTLKQKIYAYIKCREMFADVRRKPSFKPTGSMIYVQKYDATVTISVDFQWTNSPTFTEIFANKHQRFPVILNGPLCGNSLLIVHCRAFSLLETMSGSLWNLRFYGKHYFGESSLLDCRSKMIFQNYLEFPNKLQILSTFGRGSM